MPVPSCGIWKTEGFTACWKVIALVNVDLFIPIFTHVYGEARQNGKIALVSTFRLAQKKGGTSPPPDEILERTAKVALHELGHLFNLEHCQDSKCLMHFSGHLAELDETPLYYCRYCATIFGMPSAGLDSTVQYE